MIKKIKIVLGVILLSLFIVGCSPSQQPIQSKEVSTKEIPTLGIIKEDELNKISSAKQLKDLLTKENDLNLEERGSKIKTLALQSERLGKTADLDYTTTNNQVEGVDEADTTKTNGKYIFTKTNEDISIVSISKKELVHKIKANEKEQLVSFFVTDSKLIAMYRTYQELPRVSEDSLLVYSNYDDLTIVRYYDISDIKNPQKYNEFEFSGSYYQARLIDDYLYIITYEYVDYANDIVLPSLYKNGVKIAQPDVYYFTIRPSSQFYTITSMDITNPDDLVSETYLLDSRATVYVSEKNIYLGYQKRIQTDPIDRFKKTVLPLIKKERKELFEKHINREDKQAIAITLEEYISSLSQEEKKEFDKELSERLQEYNAKIQIEQEKTIIQKLSIDGTKILYHGKGEVKGHLLNQFSLDEHEGNLRVATYTSTWILGEGAEQYTTIYVLDENLEQIGSLEQLARGERMYSSRFLENKLYLVTFKQVDPLFVIDLSEPTQPRVEGKLKIPGFSTYLHPYGKTYLIGVGREVEEQEDGRTIQLGVKLSLFDVSDVENPIEVDKLVIGDGYTYTPVQYDHKAFLFDPKTRVLALPIQLSEETSKETKYGYPIRTQKYENRIYKIEKEGFVELGKFTPEDKDPKYFQMPTRTIIAGEELFSISEDAIQYAVMLNETISKPKTINLKYKENLQIFPIEPYPIVEEPVLY